MGRAEDLFARLVAEGESAVDALVADRASEELFLDFKRSADNGSGSRLHQSDRSNLAKGISGFGNAEGGVIVWGIDCRPDSTGADVARAKHPLVDPQKFVSLIEGAVSGATVPAHVGVLSRAIPSATGIGGFAVTLVPKSPLAPHQTTAPLQFYMRAGSDFQPVPYAVLQGMFGRRPHPDFFSDWRIKNIEVAPIDVPSRVTARMSLRIGNHGPGIIRELFVTAEATTQGQPRKFSYVIEKASFDVDRQPNRVSLVSHDAFKLAPGAIVTPLSIDLALEAPFVDGFRVAILYGHGSSESRSVQLALDAEKADECVREALALRRVVDPVAAFTTMFGLENAGLDA